MSQAEIEVERRESRTVRYLAAALMLALCLAAPAPRADVRPLTLYEKTGRAPLVVFAQVTDGVHRFAVIRNLGVIKCEIPERPGEAFRIAYKLDSFLRRPWEDKIEFGTGERVLLFLRKFTKEDGERPEGDLYTLMWGAPGKLILPAEGEEAQVQAARAFVEIQALEDFDEQERRLRSALSDRNPIIADGAFEEMLRQRLGDMALVPELTLFFNSTRETVRLQAMRLARQILTDARGAGTLAGGVESEALSVRLADVKDRIKGLAASDSSAAFRSEAVMTLAVLGGDDVRAFLQKLAKDDTSQEVRYEAERALMGWK